MAFKDIGPAEFVRSSARRLGRLVAQRRVSPVQLAECAIGLAKKLEPQLNAYVMFLEDYARKGAAALEAEARKGRLRGPLHGVPIAIKDNFYLKGFPATRGSRTSTEYVPESNSPMIDRMLDAGVVIIGKTTMPEFGWKGTGNSPLTGVTRNPWNPRLNTGGSSAGSAATVAAGAVPIALGSDAGGSIRIPAAFCGTVGLKPTLGRIPVWPGTVTETLSHQGPLCRDVTDAALVLRACAGPDARDPLSYGSAATANPGRRKRLRSGTLRIGVCAAPFGVQVAAEVGELFARATARLRRNGSGVFKTPWSTPICRMRRLRHFGSPGAASVSPNSSQNTGKRWTPDLRAWERWPGTIPLPTTSGQSATGANSFLSPATCLIALMS